MSLSGGAPLPFPKTRSMGGSTPYDSAGRGRRGFAWNASRLGQNTLLFSYGQDLLARSRDAVRNSAWAAAAVDSYASNAIGRGIRLVPQHSDEQVRQLIQQKWNRWVKESDVEFDPKVFSSGQTDFYGQQGLIARETMEAGEVFVRFRTRSKKEGLTVPLQLQLIEAEQLPLWRMSVEKVPPQNSVRCGIEFRPDGRRAAYHFWKAHPGETMFYPLEGLEVERVPASDILHVYKPIRAGQLRGQPWLTSVLAKLIEIEKLMDSELVRKNISSMITGFIRQVTPDNPVMPTATDIPTPTDPGAAISKLEPGTFPVLNPGEDITFAQAPNSGDFAPVLVTCLHAFAAGAGLTYEQISGDLSKVNYSSMRAGLLEFRRKCEQFQHAVFIYQVCVPIYRRWLSEAMLALVFGVDLLNQYNQDPEPFEAAHWVTPGWPWVDPEKDIKASQDAMRAGLSSRSIEVASQGRDAAAIDAEQASDNRRADHLGLSYDSDGRKVLTGRAAGMTESEISTEASKGERVQANS